MEIVSRKALVNQLDQYEVATRTASGTTIRILYLYLNQLIILSQTVTSTVVPTIPTAPINTIVPPTVITTITQTSSGNITTVTTSNTTTNPTVAPFSPYQIQFVGADIVTAMRTNNALSLTIQLIMTNPRFQHSITMVTQSCKIKGMIEFYIISENKTTGSILKIRVEYS